MNDSQAMLLKAMLTIGGATGLMGAMRGWRIASEDPEKMEELSTTSPEVMTIPMPKKKPPLLGLKTAGVGGWLTGENAKSILDIPLTPVALAAAGVGANFAANDLTQKFVLARRRAKMRKEVANAERDYTDAMLNAYPADKVANDTKAAEIDKDLEKLASLLKISNGPMVTPTQPTSTPAMSFLEGVGNSAYRLVPDFLKGPSDAALDYAGMLGNAGAGLGILGAVSIPLISSRIAYNYFRDRSKNKMLDEAARFRQYSRLQNSTPEIYVKAGE